MVINNTKLEAFRNFNHKQFVFSPKMTVIVGPNASGKTNILEAVNLLSTGKSFRARIEEEMVGYNSDLSRIIGQIGTGETTQLEAVLTRGLLDIGNGQPERVSRKKLLVNGVSRRLIDFAGKLPTVLFCPQDLELVTDAPSYRRKFMDNLLSGVDWEYRRSLFSYEKGLRQRNRLLLRIRGEGLSRSQLLFWNQLLVKSGDYLSRKREELIEFINSCSRLPAANYLLEYDKSAISESRLEQYAYEEVAAATTLVGPHRDDFTVQIKTQKTKGVGWRDLARFGSRGEQRMGVLWLKLTELKFIEKITQEKPVLLLDDIFSELDLIHREIVLDTAGKQQTIITTTEEEFAGRGKDALPESEKIRL